jgi:hypothetical protein
MKLLRRFHPSPALVVACIRPRIQLGRRQLCRLQASGEQRRHETGNQSLAAERRLQARPTATCRVALPGLPGLTGLTGLLGQWGPPALR